MTSSRNKRIRLLLAEPLPLRTTRMLGDYAENKPLPHRYGDLSKARFTLIKLNETDYFAADHPMTISAVQIADQKTDGWASETRSDDLGHTWTVVVLAAPPAAGFSVTATGLGKRNPLTGQLLENPAEIVQDFMRIAGRTDSNNWGRLRAECAAAGMRIAGSIDAVASVQSHVDAVTQSVGAIWTPGDGLLYPVSTVSGMVTTLDKSNAGNIKVQTDVLDSADILRLSYDHSEARAKPQHYIELTASPQRFGGVIKELEFPWLRNAANAEALGRRVLAWLAGERYIVSFDADTSELRPGNWVTLQAHPEWPFDGADPTLMVLEVAISPMKRTSSITAEAVLAYPTVKVTAHSVAVPDDVTAGIEVSFVNGIATFTIHDDKDAPLGGAKASLDNSATKITNGQGQVSFSAQPGHHKLSVEAASFVPFQIELDL